MTKFIGTPLRGIEFANPGDEAISSRVSGDTQPRLRIDAGGRITWSDGTNSGDTVLFRSSANSLTTYDSLTASAGLITLTTNGIPSQSLPNGAIAIDTTNHVFYFRSNNEWLEVSGGATVTVDDSPPLDPEIGDLWYSSLELELFIYYSDAWIQLTDAQGGVQELYELADVLIEDPLYGQTLVYNGTEWENGFTSVGAASSLVTARTISLTGDVSGSVAFDGSQNVSISATIQPNSVALGTDTTGNYVNDVTAGTGVTVTHTPGEGTSPTVAIGQAVGTSASVAFAAVTAPVIGNASTASALQTARNIAGQSFDGSANISIAPTDLTGVTSTAAELNILDGATLSTTELNYVDGVTSAIQTQIDTKAPSASPTFTGVVTLPDNTVALGTKTTGDYVASLVAGTGVTLTNNSGETATPTVAIGQAVGTSASVTFAKVDTTGDLTVGGNLTVNGTTTTLNTETLAIEDNIVVLNSGVTAAPTLDSGIEIERGTSANVLIRWNETNDQWEFTNDGTTYGDIAALGTIELGTDTNGNYVNDVVAGTGISVTHTPGEGSSASIALNATLDNLSDVVIASPIQFQGLMYDGTNWVNSNIPDTYLVRNNTGSTILKGTLVGAVGAEPSGRIDVAPFEVTGTENSELRAMGIVTSNISSGVNGAVMSFGTLTGLDTRGDTASALAVGDETWAAGDILFAHPTVAGKLTNVRPQHDLAVAFITVRHASSGQIAIRIIPGNNHLEWMHDVVLTSPTDGQFLRYNSASTVWVNDEINLGTDTVGNYMLHVSAGTGIAISHTQGEGSTASVSTTGVQSLSAKAGNYTLAIGDAAETIIIMDSSSANDLTVPSASAVSFTTGTSITVVQRGTGKTRILAGSGVSLLATPGVYLRARYSSCTLVKTENANEWFVIGDLAAS
jgi:hypothetical protein